MTEKTVYRISEVLVNRRGEKAARLALIHFAEMTDEEQRVELEAIRSSKRIEADRKPTITSFLETVIGLNAEQRRDLASQLREDYRDDLLSGLV